MGWWTHYSLWVSNMTTALTLVYYTLGCYGHCLIHTLTVASFVWVWLGPLTCEQSFHFRAVELYLIIAVLLSGVSSLHRLEAVDEDSLGLRPLDYGVSYMCKWWHWRLWLFSPMDISLIFTIHFVSLPSSNLFTFLSLPFYPPSFSLLRFRRL